MRPTLFLLAACLSCVVTLPAYIFPFDNARGVSWIKRVLDCPPLLYGTYDSYSKCRQLERRASQRRPQLTVLEIVEEEPGDVRIVEDEEAGIFAIRVPPQSSHAKTKKCNSDQIYVAELDICVEAEKHVVKSQTTSNKQGQEKQKEDKKEPVKILHVGKYEKEKCGPHEMWVPEVGICMDRNPPPPLEPEDEQAKSSEQQ